MLRKSIPACAPLYLTENEQKKCLCIGNFVLLQCLIVLMVASSVINCNWSPDLIDFDPYKLASVMYLYDKKACELNRPYSTKVIKNLQLSTDTKGFNVLPIRWEPADATVSSRLSEKTRQYLKLSMLFHCIWAIMTFVFKCIVKSNKNTRFITFSISVYFFIFIFVTIFDLSMALVYITHIKKALTKGMIVRHSGWSVELNIKHYDDFAGYLPMIAAGVWLKGFVVLALNIYSIKKINDIRFRLKRKRVMTRMNLISQHPFPNPMNDQDLEARTLYYRSGEQKPYVRKYFLDNE